ncbi:MAG: NYN domain-containing protein [Candidatus Hydrogenedentes bacterium]|jgi:uncharacterized LabA/DUF88 family protein|nr:NYN domain-containing protein [Candidatus Hydrogenedentota bacterium]
MYNSKFSNITESEGAAQKLAVLIDADNAQPSVIDALLAEVARFGEATVRRIYGDFTSSRSSQWKQILNKYSINPIQQFAYTTGKNATDSRLIIDAMDLLHKGNISGFCLVSSDSDFTGLASRIREEGLVVYGFGEKKTPEAFRNACNQFVFTENLKAPIKPAKTTPVTRTKKARPEGAETIPKKETSPKQGSKSIPVDFLKEAVEKACDETGWVQLGSIGSYLRKVKPDFDSRSFGFKNLTEMFTNFSETFELQDRATPQSPNKIIYVRIKEGK